MRLRVVAFLGGLLFLTSSKAAASEVLYQNDFTRAEPGTVPGQLMVLQGAFKVRARDGNRLLELAGLPLDSFGFLFGPRTGEAVEVEARIHGEKRGRLGPSFGIGAYGVGGFLLRVRSGKRGVFLEYDGKEKVSVPFKWRPAAWVFLKLRCRGAGPRKWVAEGKVWAEGEAEPDRWMVRLEINRAPPAGRSSAWGEPFSGRPIQFDDLKVVKLTPRRGE